MSNWIYRKNIWNSSAPVISLGPTLDAFFLLLDFSKEIRIVISCPDLPRKTLQKGFWEDLPYFRGQDWEAMADQMDPRIPDTSQGR